MAYLADEVGMGKTFQALGLICLVYALKPDAKIAVIAPRENVQTKWMDDYRNFIRDHYVSFDGKVKDEILGRPLHRPCFASNLREFASNLIAEPRGLHLLRLTSFRRPIVIQEDESVASVVDRLTDDFRCLGWEVDVAFRGNFRRCMADSDTGRNACRQWYAAALHSLLPEFDLVIIDEAQNLRNRGNNQNTNLARIFGFAPSEYEVKSVIRASTG